jgi:hypothetical protein
MSDSDEELNAALRGDLPPPKKAVQHKIIESDDSDDELPISSVAKTNEKGKRTARVQPKGREPVKRGKTENINTFWEEVKFINQSPMKFVTVFQENCHIHTCT